MGRMDDRVAFITGAARGQGRAQAVRFAKEGAKIIAIDVCRQIESVVYPMSQPADLEETACLVREAGSDVVIKIADVRDPGSLRMALDEGVNAFGRIDCVLANAGIMPILDVVAKTPQAWTDAIDTMLTGVLNTIEESVPHIISGGRGGAIVITNSCAGLTGVHCKTRDLATKGALGYSAAKHGAVGLMRCYASSLAVHSIRVNTVHPCGVESPMIVNEPFKRWNDQLPPAVAQALANPMPVETVEPNDVANAMLFLCSNEARYITGVTLPVDAGFMNG
jgi:SDR family mycofactocin-dependent oxidoreductase